MSHHKRSFPSQSIQFVTNLAPHLYLLRYFLNNFLNINQLPLQEMKVLLIHGLDTPGDGGQKALILRKAFGKENILCPDMKLRHYSNPLQSPHWATFLTYFSTTSTILTSLWLFIRALRRKNLKLGIIAFGLLLSSKHIYKSGKRKVSLAK